MTAPKGKDMLLKLDTTGGGDFQTVAGLRATRLTFNAQTIDATDMGSTDRWRELLAGASVRSAAISGSGVFKDDASDEKLREIFFARGTPDFEVTIPDFGDIEGPFQITSLEYSGAHDGEAVFEMALASAGDLTFTALSDRRDDFMET